MRAQIVATVPRKLPSPPTPPPPRKGFGAVLGAKTKPAPSAAASVATATAAAVPGPPRPSPPPEAPASRAPRSVGAREDKDEKPTRPAEPLELDTASRMSTLLAPPPAPIAPPPSSPAPTTTPIDPHIAAELLDKAAFWGDGHRGVARLRFGARARAGLSGATVTLEHDGDEVHLRVDGIDDPAVVERLRAQLAARGVILGDL